MANLAGKIALVTGSSKGIGAGIAKQLAHDGATVVVNYATSKEGADKVVAEIAAAGGEAVAIGGSVADPAQVKSLFAEVEKQFGRLDILVNNAGVYAFAPLDAITPEHIESIFSVNVTGLLLVSQAALPLFPKGSGVIVNIGSIASEAAPAATAVYSGTKGAVDAITRVLAGELGSRGIRVNALNPGMTETEGVRSAGFIGTDFYNKAIADTPLGRIGNPEDIGLAVSFLASDDARWVTGALLQAGGGLRR